MKKLASTSLGEFLNEYGRNREYFEGHPLSKYDENGDRKDPYALSGQTVNGEELTWEEYWDWYDREGEPDY